MNVKGKIKSVSNTEEKSAKFSVRTFVLELEGKYPELVEFQLINNNTVLINPFKEGTTIDVHFNLKGREYNGRVYNSLQVWQIEGEPNNNINGSEQKTIDPQTTTNKEEGADLPF